MRNIIKSVSSHNNSHQPGVIILRDVLGCKMSSSVSLLPFIIS